MTCAVSARAYRALLNFPALLEQEERLGQLVEVVVRRELVDLLLGLHVSRRSLRARGSCSPGTRPAPSKILTYPFLFYNSYSLAFFLFEFSLFGSTH